MSIKILLKITSLALFILSYSASLHAQELKIPNFWDKNERFTRPDLSTLPRMRFLTTTDFPPFNFIDRKKRLSGFHIDLARAICDELGVLNRCQIQALPWDELQPAMAKGEGEAIIAGVSITQENRRNLDFSRTYLNIPGRFITRKDSGLSPPVYDAIFQKKTAVVKDSAHAAYFAKIFANRSTETYETKEVAFAALQKGEVETFFSDGLSLSFWLSSNASKDCCIFLDEAFLSNYYFGNGLAVALPKEKPELVQAINFALKQINQSGEFTELYLRYFPLGLY